MKKKLIIIVSLIIILLVLLIPIPRHLKDGGTVEYNALLYKVTKYHQLVEDSDFGYIEGTQIKILGIEIYNSVKGKNNKAESNEQNKTIDENKINERIVKINGKLYYENKEAEKFSPTCGTMDGYITSHVKSDEIPTEDNQSNFEGDYGYQYVYKNIMIVLTEEGWITFKSKK